MTTFVLIPGAGGQAATWAELVPELERLGHPAIAIDIREDDPNLSLRDWAQVVDDAIGERRGVVLVAQSLGGFTAPMVTKRQAVRGIVLLNAMVPLPGECFDDWWGATGSGEALRAAAEAGGYTTDFDPDTYFFHDLPDDVKQRLLSSGEERGPSEAIGRQPCEFGTWPDVPITVVVARDDRFFPADFQVRVARERLAGVIDPDRDITVVPGGHLVAMSRARELADLLAGQFG